MSGARPNNDILFNGILHLKAKVVMSFPLETVQPTFEGLNRPPPAPLTPEPEVLNAAVPMAYTRPFMCRENAMGEVGENIIGTVCCEESRGGEVKRERQTSEKMRENEGWNKRNSKRNNEQKYERKVLVNAYKEKEIDDCYTQEKEYTLVKRRHNRSDTNIKKQRSDREERRCKRVQK